MSVDFLKIYGDARFQIRNDTLDNWQEKNPVLDRGEPSMVVGLHEVGDGLQGETEIFKIGDGIHTWSELPWWKGPKGENYILTEDDKQEIANMVKPPIDQSYFVGQKTEQGGEIFNDYENNQAGIKGYRVQSIELSDDGLSALVTLNDTNLDDEAFTVYAEEDVINLLIDLPYYNVFKIASIPEGSLQLAPIFPGYNGDPTSTPLPNGGETYTSFAIAKVDGTPIMPEEIALEKADPDSNWAFVVGKSYGEPIPLSFFAHAEGVSNKALGLASHVEGIRSLALGHYAHAEGRETAAVYAAHSEGWKTNASGQTAHAEGFQTIASEESAHSEGYLTKSKGFASHSEGHQTEALEETAHAEGKQTIAIGKYSHSEGQSSKSIGEATHAEGYITSAEGRYSHTEGNQTKAIGDNSHAEGGYAQAIGACSHAGGCDSRAGGYGSFAHGYQNVAYGNHAVSLGKQTVANGHFSFIHGFSTTRGDWGLNGITFDNLLNKWKYSKFAFAFGEASTAFGKDCLALGNYSFAAGLNALAKGEGAVALGNNVVASNPGEVAVGIFNKQEKDCLFSVGNGSSDSNRSNAFAVYKDGSVSVSGVKITPEQLTKLLALLN